VQKINAGRVLLGGLVAGLVMNASEAAAGPMTAIYAGLAVWALAHLWSGVYLGAGFTGLISPRLAWLPVVWGLFEAPIGTLVGAWLSRE
jgi:hypothetical protein